MKLEELQELVQQGESLHLEFKKSTSQLSAAFETICAFLNNKGGTVLLGVSNNKKIIGQHVTDNTQQEIANAIKKIEPHAHIEIHYIHIKEDLKVIALEVPAGKHIPYVYDGRPYQRNISTTDRMTQHLYEQLIIQRGQLNHNWDEFLTNEYGIEDLDHEEIQRTIEEGIHYNRISPVARNSSIEQILKNFDLIQNDKLTNAAVVLFARDPENIFSRCEIQMARFRGKDKLQGFMDNQLERGNAFQLINLAHKFASSHLPIASFFEPGKIARIDQPAVPQLALREALTNAFCHRDYSVTKATPALAIYDDRLELWNPGGLLPDLTIEQLKSPHKSFQRNKLISNVFYKRGWIEKWGTGTIRMIDYCRNNKTPDPDFFAESNGFSVLFPFKESKNTGIMKPKSPVKQNLTLRQQEIINILEKAEKIPASTINQELKKSVSPRVLLYELANLKEKGIINSAGSTRNTIWYLNK